MLFNIFVYSFFPLLMISIVIVIHELGHYWAGRLFNASTKSFSMGFGPQIFGVRDKRGTMWKLSLLPLGGFVSWYNEKFAEEGDPVPEGVLFTDLSPWKRMVVAIAGPAANFVLAIAIFAGFSMVFGSPRYEIEVIQVEEGSAAEAAGLLPGDIFLDINGHDAQRQDRFHQEIKLSSGKEIYFTVLRGTQEIDLKATPQRAEMDNGIGITQKTGKLGIEYRPRLVDRNRLKPIEAVGHGVGETINTVSTSVRMISRIISGEESVHMLSGPVGIANAVGTTAKVSLEQETTFAQRLMILALAQVELCAFISVAVGFLNILPLPVLDGGQVVFNAYEAVTGRGPSERIQTVSVSLTLAFLVMMVIVITFGDFQETGLLEVFHGL